MTREERTANPVMTVEDLREPVGQKHHQDIWSTILPLPFLSFLEHSASVNSPISPSQWGRKGRECTLLFLESQQADFR